MDLACKFILQKKKTAQKVLKRAVCIINCKYNILIQYTCIIAHSLMINLLFLSL